MSKRQATLRQAGILLLVSAPALFADVVSFTGLPANQDYGTYNGFVSGTINNSTPFDDLICDDFGHTTYLPSGNLNYNLSTLNSLQFVRFAGPGEVDNYRAAAILVKGLIEHPTMVSDYQYALWELFTPDTPDEGNANALLADALNLVQHGDISGYAGLFSELRVYTPTGDSVSNQEFLEIDPPAAVPEPDSIVLMVTVAALILVGQMRRRGARAN